MMQDVTLFTCTGGMKIVYIQQFAKMVKHHIVQQPYVEVPMLEQPRAFWDCERRSEIEFVPPLDTSITRQAHELKLFHEVNEMEMMSVQAQRNGFSALMREKMAEKAFKCIEEEFKIMVAKKMPAFFMKDLSLENVEKLSEEFAKNWGSEAAGVNVKLSDYQKFFAIADPSDFCFYLCEIRQQRIDKPGVTVEYRGKLVDLRPDKWVMGRYEDLTYLKELSAQRMYQGPK